ncbi:MAG: fibronectin type III domain-containing protein, partial [Acidimicrobiia bacterium]|nr:fibronectin type III domain-containing protein [Acidimicrobiia bacterium]
YMAGNQITVIPSPATSTVFGQSVTPNQPTTLDPGTPGTLSGLVASPFGLAFDASGDLFISSSDGISSNQIIVVPSASATSIFGQSVTPEVPVVLDPGAAAGNLSNLLNEPNGIAFDQTGDLFVANYSGNTVTVIPTETVPDPPTDVAAVPSDGQVLVSWNAPLDTGGPDILGYTATVFPGEASCTSTTTSCVITGLTNGETYSISVTATNAIGMSDPSDAISVTIELVPAFTG